MKLKVIRILNSPVYNDDRLEVTKEIEDHLEMMCKVMHTWPLIMIVEIEL